jgi:hypothetical protein
MGKFTFIEIIKHKINPDYKRPQYLCVTWKILNNTINNYIDDLSAFICKINYSYLRLESSRIKISETRRHQCVQPIILSFFAIPLKITPLWNVLDCNLINSFPFRDARLKTDRLLLNTLSNNNLHRNFYYLKTRVSKMYNKTCTFRSAESSLYVPFHP